jgi:hypothetical protein
MRAQGWRPLLYVIYIKTLPVQTHVAFNNIMLVNNEQKDIWKQVVSGDTKYILCPLSSKTEALKWVMFPTTD